MGLIIDLTEKAFAVINNLPPAQGVSLYTLTDSEGNVITDSDGNPILANW